MNANITIIQPSKKESGKKKEKRPDIIPIDWDPDGYRQKLFMIGELERFAPGSISLN